LSYVFVDVEAVTGSSKGEDTLDTGGRLSRPRDYLVEKSEN